MATKNTNYSKKYSPDFWTKVRKISEEGCWVWEGSQNPSGYGVYLIEGKPSLAHRVAYFLLKGRIPRGKILRHTCDVRRCVNPAHLIPGSHRENSMDMYERGRARGPEGEKKVLNTDSSSLICSFYLAREDKEKIARLGARWNMPMGRVVTLLVRAAREDRPGVLRLQTRKSW